MNGGAADLLALNPATRSCSREANLNSSLTPKYAGCYKIGETATISCAS